jgi:hypothetical protein
LGRIFQRKEPGAVRLAGLVGFMPDAGGKAALKHWSWPALFFESFLFA